MAERQPEIVTVEPHFPFLIPLVRHGRAASIVVAVLALLLTLLLSVSIGWVSLLAALIVAALAYGAMGLLTDIARLLVDTLVPK